MDSNGDPGWSLGALWGSRRVLRRFTGHEFNRWRGTWSLREGLGTSWKTFRGIGFNCVRLVFVDFRAFL